MSISYFSRVKYGFWLALFCILCVVQGNAQDTIVYFDRPGIGDGPYITQKGKMNIESGFAYTSLFGIESSYVPGILSRYQLTSGSELRVMYNYAPQSLKFLMDADQNDYSFVSAGFKRRIGRTPDLFADMAFCGNVFYPTQKLNDLSGNSTCFESYLLFEHNAPTGSYINYSLGYIYGGGHLKNMTQWSFAGNLQVKKILFFAEYFGYYQFVDDKAEFGFDGGIIYEFNGNMQVDFSVIYNKYGMQDAVFYAIGYSVCINK